MLRPLHLEENIFGGGILLLIVVLVPGIFGYLSSKVEYLF